MTKLSSIVLGSIILILSYLALTPRGADLSLFMDTGQMANILRAFFAIGLCSYVCVGRVRNYATHHLVGALGIFLLGAALATTFIVPLSEALPYYIKPLDGFFMVEWGIFALVCAAELPLHTSIRRSYVRRQLLPLRRRPRLATQP